MSATPKKILVAVDGSDGSRRALEAAVGLAQAMDAELTVLEVVEGPAPAFVQGAAPSEGQVRVRRMADPRFEFVRSVLEGEEIRWSRRVEEGYPAEVLCAVAEEEQADLIALGGRGLTTTPRFRLGSVAARVVRHAPCSVMVVR